jgi:hypothetical protein
LNVAHRTIAVTIVSLNPESVAPYVLSYALSYDPKAARGLWQALWKNVSGTSTTTIKVPKDRVCIIITKDSASPTALGAAFSLHQSGWISIPSDLIGRILRPAKPFPADGSVRLDQFYAHLSASLYETGEGCGLAHFTNGNAMRFDIKQNTDHPWELKFKTMFLPKGSYSSSEYDPAAVLKWPEDISLKTTSHGKTGTDGWSAFNLFRSLEATANS